MLYVLGDGGPSAPPAALRISRDFFADPLLFIAAGDVLVQKFLVQEPQSGRERGGPSSTLVAGLASRFHFLEPPKSATGDLLAKLGWADDGSGRAGGGEGSGGEYMVRDVAPLGGTLVLFDSVALPHEVLATVRRERFACSGWFHEDQQPEHHPA